MENDNVEKTDPSVLDDFDNLPGDDLDDSADAAAATAVNLDMLVNDSTGTQIKDAFKAAGIELDEFPPPGASSPGVYNGVQIVDAFKAWNKANPGKIDMNTISVGMRGTQVVDAFKIMLAPTAPGHAPKGSTGHAPKDSTGSTTP